MGQPASRGFTLVEMLVTLVIVGMLSTLVGQAMVQLARVERLLESSGSEAQALLVRREWLRELLAASLPEQVGVNAQFRGDDKSLQLRSALGADVGASVLTLLRLELHHDAATQRNELRLAIEPQSAFEAVRAPTVLFRWTGPAGSIRYRDPRGNWVSQWPLQDAEAVNRPPALVELVLGPEAGGPLWVAVGSGEPPRGRLTEWLEQ